MRKKDLRGLRFGRLTALRDSGKRKHTKVVWVCLCICGNFTEVSSISLISGNTKSCGCLQRDVVRKTGQNNFIHGESERLFQKETRLHRIWRQMKRRCYNSNSISYKYYGAKGVGICGEWKNSFVKFRDWAQNNGYRNSLTIDRIDNDGNYEPSNCQWLTASENSKKCRQLIASHL